jgi:deazaflavin-dependent oxidoreductase (nitroreductase family)
VSTETAASARQIRRRRILLALWKVMNPVARRLAPIVPWWVVVETTGWRSGKVRRVPVARGPRDRDDLWLLAAHDRRASWVRNIEHEPEVRVRLGLRWHTGRAQVRELDELLARFNGYARGAAGPPVAIEPCLVRVALRGRSGSR